MSSWPWLNKLGLEILLTLKGPGRVTKPEVLDIAKALGLLRPLVLDNVDILDGAIAGELFAKIILIIALGNDHEQPQGIDVLLAVALVLLAQTAQPG